MIDTAALKARADIAYVVGRYVDLKQEAGGRHLAGLCPFHREKSPSFKVTPDKGMWWCFGCNVGGDVLDFVAKVESVNFGEAAKRLAEMVGAEDLLEPDKQVQPRVTATYPYRDEDGRILYEIERWEPGKDGKKKDFLQRFTDESGQRVYRKHPRQVLFQLPDVIGADQVVLVEGEKDALAVTAAGMVGTTNAGGSNSPWLDSYTDVLRGKTVFVIPDNDPAGRKRAERIVEAIGKVAQVVVVTLPGAKDSEAWIRLHSPEEFRELLLVAAKKETEKRGLWSIAEIVNGYEGGYNAFLDPTKIKPGVRTGFSAFDEMTLGFMAEQLIILAARPAMGKTAMALNIAAYAAEKQRVPVDIFSLEMSKESLLTRMMCAEAQVNAMRFRSGQCDEVERENLQRALAQLADLPIRIDDSAALTLKTLRDRLAWKADHGGLGLVILDYLQLMSVRGKENRTQEVSTLSRGLKILAREFKVPIIALSQLSRASETRTDPRPQLSDLRESGSIEQDADIVAMIYREEVYKPDKPDAKGTAELIIRKQRNGPIGTCRLQYVAKYTTFCDQQRW